MKYLQALSDGAICDGVIEDLCAMSSVGDSRSRAPSVTCGMYLSHHMAAFAATSAVKWTDQFVGDDDGDQKSNPLEKLAKSRLNPRTVVLKCESHEAFSPRVSRNASGEVSKNASEGAAESLTSTNVQSRKTVKMDDDSFLQGTSDIFNQKLLKSNNSSNLNNSSSCSNEKREFSDKFDEIRGVKIKSKESACDFGVGMSGRCFPSTVVSRPIDYVITYQELVRNLKQS